MGLNQLIAFSVPVLVTLYPIVIVLILLVFLEPLFNGKREVYVCSIFLTALISLLDGMQAAGLQLTLVHQWLNRVMPLYAEGFGWVVPAIVGVVLGYCINVARKSNSLSAVGNERG